MCQMNVLWRSSTPLFPLLRESGETVSFSDVSSYVSFIFPVCYLGPVSLPLSPFVPQEKTFFKGNYDFLLSFNLRTVFNQGFREDLYYFYYYHCC